MGKFNITKRDVKFFFLGILTMFLIESLLDWEGSVQPFTLNLKR